MNFALRVFSAAGQLFGAHQTPTQTPMVPNNTPPQSHAIGDAGIAAALIALGAKLAKADGFVSQNEINAFKRIFQTSKAEQAGIDRFFNLARKTSHGYASYGRIVAQKYKNRPDVLEDVLDGLFHIAKADGIVNHEEISFLRHIGEIFGFDKLVFERIRIGHMGIDTQAENTSENTYNPYLILGVHSQMPMEEIKQAYRNMATLNHPDRLAARGLPRELRALATHKMALINKAYDDIQARH